jgi:hypothetical protein
MEAAILFIIDVLTSLIIWNKLSKKYFLPRIKSLELKKAVQPILVLHCFRFAGLSFLVPGVVNTGLILHGQYRLHLAILPQLFWLL